MDLRRVYIWREENTRYLPCNIKERDTYAGESVLVWGGISLGWRIDLCVLPHGTLIAQKYRNDVLDPTVRPYAGAIAETFTLQADNARPHIGRFVH